jgi:xanthine/CO dehydrogenase XdhC/CoxF family maturation factor
MQGIQELAGAVRALEGPAALATLARVKGSSYRLPGARMLFGPDGVRTGIISAGCLETDILARVGTVLDSSRPQLAAYDLGSALDLVWGTGMGCQGQADVLLERVGPGPEPAWLGLAAALLDRRGSGALATVFAVRGEDAGLAPGAHFLLDRDGGGLPPGTGAFQGAIAQALDRTLAGTAARTVTLRAGQAEADLLLEPLLPPYALWIVGAGEHAMPLARMAKELGWFVGLVDHRPALATPARFPQADRIVLGHPPASLEGLPLDRRSAALVVSHVYDQDRRALAALIGQPLGYLGLQGNRARCQQILKDLADEGLELDEVRRASLHFPAGLDIGAESPEGIALSMLAEVQAVLAGRTGAPLRGSRGRIHG